MNQASSPLPVALVTGASRGIGRAVALALAKRGYFVVINYRSLTAQAEQVLDEVRGLGGDGTTYQADVTDPGQVQTMFRDIQKQHGFVELLVNNAGVTRDGMFLRMATSSWSHVMDTNLNAVFHACKAASRTMAAKGRGVIVCIGSGSGISPRAGQVNYSSTKSALLGFVRSLARELASKGVRCVTVAPGFTKTEMAEAIPQDAAQESLRMIPMGRWGLPEEIAEVVAYVASPAARSITGVTIVVDGGRAGMEQDFGTIG
jgi:3-oxoacyl-[acyl-carrier protein] reductase